MSTMSQPLPAVEDRMTIAAPQPDAVIHPLAGLRRLHAPLRMLIGLLVAPLLLVAALLSFVVVLADFAFFRLRDLRAGHPQPKGLWEF
jgi:hypothetical protein